VEKSAFAGLPSTEICLGCHSQIWRDSALLAPVRESFQSGKPLAWTRVHDMPDFVYFNHSIHVAKGIGCESCHGPVDKMPLMRKTHAMHMEWCLECHRHPEVQVRERGDIFKFGHRGKAETASHKNRSETSEEEHPKSDKVESPPDGEQLVKDYGIVKAQLTDCVMCHR
jgi:hypothetical protein